ncbi:MAG: aldo/keto reductase [Candidatus Tectomicrobia bacterium]|nr:aldo/keto reductase [Candidatus Tectomicrobia bacterium]
MSAEYQEHERDVERQVMPTRPLGRTGHEVGLFSLGGQGVIEQADSEDMAIAVVRRALDLGVNYIDTAPRYTAGARESETNIGKALRGDRHRVFLATKTHDRSRDGSLKLLDESLELLRTDHVDLWQIHNIQYREEIERIFASDGALEALLQARDDGRTRFLGITGHFDPAPLLEGLRRFDFDCILMALNAADPHRASFAAQLLPTAVEKQMGIIAMKVPARGRILSTWNPSPASEQDFWAMANRPGTISMQEALHYVWTHPVSTAIVGCDHPGHVEANADAAEGFAPLATQHVQEIEARTAPIARQALFFRNWAEG